MSRKQWNLPDNPSHYVEIDDIKLKKLVEEYLKKEKEIEEMQKEMDLLKGELDE